MKHVGAVLLILKCFNNSAFFNVVCVSWLLKCWILLMHGATMKYFKSSSYFMFPHQNPVCVQRLLHPV